MLDMIAKAGAGFRYLADAWADCRAGESADFEVEACDAKGRLALPRNRTAQNSVPGLATEPGVSLPSSP